MAIDNVEIGRRGHQAFREGGVEAILPFLYPDAQTAAADPDLVAASRRRPA
jgi:hypothetical protein